MMKERLPIDRDAFRDLSAGLMAGLAPGEALTANLVAESTRFTRVSRGRIRQTGVVDEAFLGLMYMKGPEGAARVAKSYIQLTGDRASDAAAARSALGELRREAEGLPADPFSVPPKAGPSAVEEFTGRLVPHADSPAELLRPLEGLDVGGIYASGPVARGCATSAGHFHWFSTELFTFDYSLFVDDERAVKGTFAGREWSSRAYEAEIRAAREKAALLEAKPVSVPKGEYRAFLEPSAACDLVGMFSWRCIGESYIRQGESPLRLLRSGERRLSPLFSLAEDFTRGTSHRFSELGEVAPDRIPLIERGELKGALVSSRTAKEYSVEGNGADTWESLRAPTVAPGGLPRSRALQELGTGLYLSNLHYLNWSDQSAGRVTGMTRYACFWVENGRIVGPIENLRFDDSLFRLLGEGLVAATDSVELVPEVGSYDFRQIGGTWVPGLLVDGMKFTL